MGLGDSQRVLLDPANTRISEPGDWVKVDKPIPEHLQDHLEFHLGRSLREQECQALLHPMHAEAAQAVLNGPEGLETAIQKLQDAQSAEMPPEDEHTTTMTGLLAEVSGKHLETSVSFAEFHLESHLGNPLDDMDKKRIQKIAVENPQLFGKFLEALSRLGGHPAPSAEEAATELIGLIPEGSRTQDALGFLMNILKEVEVTRSLTGDLSIGNTQFNSDDFDRKEGDSAYKRLLGQHAAFKKLFANPPEAQELYVDSPRTVAAHKKNIAEAQGWCQKNGFQNVAWWPNGQTGRGMLFSAGWDEPKPGQDDRLISRHIGMMVNGKIFMTRLEHRLEEGQTRESFVKNPSKEFRDRCESVIQDMHREFGNAKPGSKKVYKPLNI